MRGAFSLPSFGQDLAAPRARARALAWNVQHGQVYHCAQSCKDAYLGLKHLLAEKKASPAEDPQESSSAQQ